MPVCRWPTQNKHYILFFFVYLFYLVLHLGAYCFFAFGFETERPGICVGIEVVGIWEELVQGDNDETVLKYFYK